MLLLTSFYLIWSRLKALFCLINLIFKNIFLPNTISKTGNEHLRYLYAYSLLKHVMLKYRHRTKTKQFREAPNVGRIFEQLVSREILTVAETWQSFSRIAGDANLMVAFFSMLNFHSLFTLIQAHFLPYAHLYSGFFLQKTICKWSDER